MTSRIRPPPRAAVAANLKRLRSTARWLSFDPSGSAGLKLAFMDLRPLRGSAAPATNAGNLRLTAANKGPPKRALRGCEFVDRVRPASPFRIRPPEPLAGGSFQFR